MTICHAYTFGTYALLMEPYQPEAAKAVKTMHFVFQIMMLTSSVLQIVYIAGMFLLKCHTQTANRMYIYMAFCLFMSQVLTVLSSYFFRDDWERCATFTGN